MTTMRVFVALFFCCLLAGCAAVGERYKHVPDSKQRAIILVHGFYGANLNRVEDGERIWLNANQVFWKSNTLAVDDGTLAIDGAQKLTEDGILRRVKILPLFYQEDAYGETLEYLEKEFGANHQIIPFAYDWRQDNTLSVQALGALIEQLHLEGKQKIIVIGHSMGGAILAYYLRYGTQKPELANESWSGSNRIDLAVIVGAPFRGTIHILKNMQEGVKLFWNSSLLKPEAYASFPSAYQMLPGTLPLLSRKGESLPVDTFSLENWKARKWGLLGNSSVNPSSLEKRIAFTQNQLSNSSAFRNRLEAGPNTQKESDRQKNLPAQAKTPVSRNLSQPRARLLNFVGTGRPTLNRAILLTDGDQDPGVLLFTEADLKEHTPGVSMDRLMSDGDETITVDSARLPDPYRTYLNASEILVRAKHSAMLQDESVREALAQRIHAL